ncbi:tetratricopeptide repeat protein [Actinoplanes sp. Pm04-4]|uniref:Tetratricopeptide repeat protein n=1 Tax=Paractinoplanes pyxinae TaxID=2997416 RepID=A0ABT4AXL7_9ACTN|nr:tetratricopeptide repeat protein [Actinoplanes pyxinae]MCY1138981.1 tetratricopeptide repeat protein [Actinoplanes pyxinae]
MPESSTFAHARQQAQQLVEAGDPAGAQKLLEGVVANGRVALAEGDPELLETMRQLAGRHAAAGDPQSARRVLEEAAGRLTGSDPLAVMLAYDLAVVAEELANRHVARTNFAKVAEFGPAALGEDHWTVERARTYLASVTTEAPQPPTSDAPPVSPAPQVSGPPASAASASPAPLNFGSPVYEPGPRVAPTPPSRRRGVWLPAVLGAVAGGVVVAVVVAVVLTRPDDPVQPATAVQEIVPTTSAAAIAPPVSRAPSPSSASPPSLPAATTAATTTAAAEPTAAKPTKAKPTTKAPVVRTRIVAPANNSRVPYPFDARFSVAAADVSAKDTVVALLICVAGRCYLDGKLDIIEDSAAPYTVFLGSTRPEGTNVAWKLRLDRLPAQTYTTLVAARDKAIADGSWGDKGTPMSALNATPLSTLTVTKAP